MAGEDEKYYFPETLNQQERWLGLPKDEFIVVVPLVVAGVYFNMSTVMSIVAALLWWLVRYLKKGQGSYWMLNFCYWHLPFLIFKLSFRQIPDSSFRHWRA